MSSAPVPSDEQLLSPNWYRDTLLNDVLPFWIENGVDVQSGGIMSALDRDGTLVDSDKGVWQQGRFAWLLGELYNEPHLAQFPDRDLWRNIATATLDFLTEHAFDPSDGRMYFHLTREGLPIRKRRYAYSESFAAIAFAEWAAATGREDYRKRARACFDQFLVRAQCPPPDQRKYTDVRPMIGLGPSMIAIVTARQLIDSIAITDGAKIVEQHIDNIFSHFVKPDLQCVMENVAPDGEIYDHFDGRLLNPGHAIEAAWFIMREGELASRDDWIQQGANMAHWMFDRGWDPIHGGLKYFVDVYNRPVQEYWHEMKFWWPHNEAMIAMLLAWRLTGQESFRQRFLEVARWAVQHFSDPEFGEWYGYLRHDGTPSSSLKGNLWKGPFHLPRMLLECWRIVRS